MNKKLVSLSFVTIVFLAGCGHRYQIKPLKHVKKTEAHFIEKKENIELRIQKLPKEEIKQIFNGRYFGQYIIPLLVTIKNTSSEPITLDQKNITLELLSTQQIYAHFSKSIAGNVFSTLATIYPLFFVTCSAGVLGIAILALKHSSMTMTCFYLLEAGLLASIPLMIAIAKHSVENTSQFNTELLRDINRKVLSTQTIAPGTKESALLFTKDLPETFTVTLLKEQQPVLFAVTLKNQITK